MRKAQRALTLLESILAFGLLTSVALALLAVFLSGTRMIQQSDDLTMATDVCREFLEAVKYDGYDLLSVGVFDGRVPNPVNSTTNFPPSPYPTTQRNNKDYHLLVEVTQAGPEVRLVKVQVYWEESRHHTSMATMLHL